MNENEHKNKNIKNIFVILAIIILFFVLYFVRNNLQKSAKNYINSDNSSFAKNVSADNKLLQEFTKLYADREVILACEDDITNDGRNDLVVISKNNKEIETIALIDMGNNKFITTEPIPAPKENQFIKFFNMDKSGAKEVLITGEKKGQVGYAIYRYEDGKLIDIFGEGMEDCC